MDLQFGEEWLDPNSSKFAADLRILGNVGNSVVRFVVPRPVALKYFKPPQASGAEEGLARWARTLQLACQAAFRRTGADTVPGDITVADADFAATARLT
ncbi:MAG: hypothetical protein IT562_21605 [Alphaproteobacteria bacterium]|nr:hypothetical protein [Alphaproteobacteria bacterium]